MQSFILLFFFFLINQPERVSPCDSCKESLTGWFMVQGNEHIKVHRTLKRQVERNTRNGKLYRYKIRWTGPCRYDLILTGTSDKNRVVKDQLREKVPMPHQVLSISDTAFTYETEFSFMSADNCGSLRRHVQKTETLIRLE